MDSDQFREAAHSVVDKIAEYYDTIEQRRVLSNVEPGYLRKLLPDKLPEHGEPWAEIQKDVEAKILPGITHWQSPNFLSWFPSSSSFPAMLGEMYSNAFSCAAFNWVCSPAVTELETIVMDWLARAFALPESYLSTGPTHGGGVIHGSASEAIVTVMVAARDKYLHEATSHLPRGSEEQEDAMAVLRGRLVALGSTATHSATQKAAMVAGVRFRTVPVRAEDDYCMTGAGLRTTIAQVQTKGLIPFYLTVTLGTTNTCSTDDFDSIVTVLDDFNSQPQAPSNKQTGIAGNSEVWVHVDAAYAGVALLCPEYQHLAKHFDRFHSFNTNPHKWLLVNFDCSTIWVRRREWLIDALRISLEIVRNEYSDVGLVTDYRDWQIPFGRRFRSLKVWFVLRTYGVQGLRAHIRKHVGLGEQFATLMKERKDLFEIVAGPRFALTVFKLKGKEGETLAEQNQLTKRMHEAVNAEGKIFLSSTLLGDVFTIRHCPSTPFVESQHVDEHFAILVRAAEKELGRAN